MPWPVKHADDGTTTKDVASAGTMTGWDTLGSVAARTYQTATIGVIKFNIDYTVQGNGKMFVHVTAVNTGGSVAAKTLRFVVEGKVPAAGNNPTVTLGNATANISPYVLLSCDSLKHLDVLLAPFTNWNTANGASSSATGFYQSGASGYAGYECNAWALAAGQRET